MPSHLRPIAFLLAASVAMTASAQGTTRPTPAGGAKLPPARPNQPLVATSKTIINVELLTAKDGGALNAQEWVQVFERIGYEVRIRQPILDDKADVSEKQVGTTRVVTVIGKLDRGGNVSFPGKAFARSDGTKLKEWLNELKTYGAQGNPKGKPLWGLTEAQFAIVYSAVGKKIETEVEGMPLAQALTEIGVPEKYPLRLTVAAREWLASEYPKPQPVRNRLQGMSLGTALAILLNEYGLGFRPLRTAEGAMELAVDPLKVNRDAWPAGWELKEGQSRQQLAPKLFEFVPVELEKASITDVLAAVSQKTGLPIHVDHYRIEGKSINIDELTVTVAPRRTTWSLLLKSATNPNKLTRRLQIDELGQPFLWITVLDPTKRDD
jgi:hypothetical protein